MLIVRTENAVAAWRETLIRLFRAGAPTHNQKYARDEVVLIELESPSLEASHPLFPMTQSDLDIINRYIYTGENESLVTHEWTKVYFHRMFDEPHCQIKYLLETLRSSALSRRAQISIWDKSVDQGQEIAPCTQIVWAQKKQNKLEMHVHARCSDAYTKLLMNLQEFISLQQFLAGSLNLAVGRYYHFLDSCHIHYEDEGLCEEVVRKLELERTD